MNSSLHSGKWMLGAGIRRLAALALFTFAVAFQPLQAQISSPVPAPVVPGMGPAAGAAAFGQTPAQPPTPPGSANSSPAQWSRSSPDQLNKFDPFQPRPRFGNFSAAPSNGVPMRMGPGRQAALGSNPFGAVSMGGRSDNLGPLFPMSGNLTPGLANGANRLFGATPGAVPSLNQLMRGNLSLPLNASYGSFRLSYRDNLFGPGGSAGVPGRSASSAMFSTSDLGNGMYLSAGSMYGSRPMAGAPAAGLGGIQSGGAKHSGTSLAIKLSF